MTSENQPDFILCFLYLIFGVLSGIFLYFLFLISDFFYVSLGIENVVLNVLIHLILILFLLVIYFLVETYQTKE